MLLLLSAWLVGCPASERCDLQALAAAAAPRGASDCGTAEVDDPAPVHGCIVAAFEAGEAFQGTVQRRLGDELLATAWVGDEEGVVSVITGDFTSCAPSGCRGAVIERPCDEVFVDRSGEVPQLRCAWETPPCGTVLCGDVEALDCPG